MDAESSRLFDSVRLDAIELHLRWKLFRHLYVGDRNGIDFPERRAASVFDIFRSLLIDDCILRICKLTDFSHAVYEYRSIPQLVAMLERLNSPLFDAELPLLVTELSVACAPMRAVRNQAVAHSDYRRDSAPPGTDQTRITATGFSSALQLVCTILNRIEVPHRNSRTFYRDALLDRDSNADQFLGLLERAHGGIVTQRCDRVDGGPHTV